jgi:monoamine oxidase
MNRRRFLLASAGLASMGGICSCAPHSWTEGPFSGSILGASHNIGHLVKEGRIPTATRERKVPVVIVGGGISGLSAGWKLDKAGFGEFEILELETEIGGNSRFGENQVSSYPWGAHYVPIPTKESRAVRELLQELGVIQGYTSSGQPVFEEKYLCFSPQERLYIHGRWQEGLIPSVGVTQRDLDQYERFKDLVAHYKGHKGRDGRKAFSIPMELSSLDKDLLALDQLSFRDFLHNNGFDSVPFHWYMNYACRDDYGCTSADVSAWAGIHYFASRDGGTGELEDSTVLTWPEGNGWIVKQLRHKLQSHVTTEALVFRIDCQSEKVTVEFYHPKENVSTRIVAQDVIFACPKHLVKYIITATRSPSTQYLNEFQYAPWLVANLTLKSFPIERTGTPIAWDNVIYDSESLGYVVATHQSLRTHLSQTVFTYYYPLTGASPAEGRNRLLETSWKTWAGFILKDLSKPHPEIYALVSHLDIFRWGHAMVRPRPGFVWGEARRKAAENLDHLYFAHSDLSGFSIFEEAQYRGVLAAEQVLSKNRIPFSSSL